MSSKPKKSFKSIKIGRWSTIEHPFTGASETITGTADAHTSPKTMNVLLSNRELRQLIASADGLANRFLQDDLAAIRSVGEDYRELAKKLDQYWVTLAKTAEPQTYAFTYANPGATVTPTQPKAVSD